MSIDWQLKGLSQHVIQQWLSSLLIGVQMRLIAPYEVKTLLAAFMPREVRAIFFLLAYAVQKALICSSLACMCEDTGFRRGECCAAK